MDRLIEAGDEPVAPVRDAVRFAELTGAHANAVHALHRKVLAETPRGFLAERSEHEIGTILSNSLRSASVGAWLGGTLVAYALSSPEDPQTRAQTDCPLLRLVRRRNETLLAVRGYAVDPDVKGHRLGFQLIAERKALARAKGLDHAVALGATGNLSSFNAALKGGSWFAGIARDEYCLNFVTYSGPLVHTLATDGEMLLPVEDLAALREHLDAGWIGTAIIDYKSGEPTCVTMRHCRALAPDRT